jgi:AcrR family transcriptional regulator
VSSVALLTAAAGAGYGKAMLPSQPGPDLVPSLAAEGPFGAPDPPRRARQRADRRRRLLAAGLASFADLGFGQTTVRDITGRADLGHGTFYQYFRSKEDLLLALVAECVSAIEPRLDPPGTDAAELPRGLARGILGVLTWFEEHRGVLLALREAVYLDEAILTAWEPARDRLGAWVGAYLDRGKDLGLARGLGRDRAIDLTLNLLIGVAYEATLNRRYGREVDLTSLAEETAAYCANALFRLPEG